MQLTDIICILFSATAPYMLPATKNREGCLYIGECYVHGLMSSEAVDDSERGRIQVNGFITDNWVRY